MSLKCKGYYNRLFYGLLLIWCNAI